MSKTVTVIFDNETKELLKNIHGCSFEDEVTKIINKEEMSEGDKLPEIVFKQQGDQNG